MSRNFGHHILSYNLELWAVRKIDVTRNGDLVYARAVGSVDLYKAELDLATGRLIGRPSLINTGHRGANFGPWLSPDGGRLGYLDSPHALPNSRRHRYINIRDLKSGKEREIRVNGLELVSYTPVAWAPDGEKILAQGRDSQQRWALCEIDLKTEQTRVLRGGSEFQLRPIGWTADGEEALYQFQSLQLEDGKSVKAIAAVSPGGSEPRLLYTAETSIRATALSPSRDRIALMERLGKHDDPLEALRVMAVESGEVQTMFQAKSGDRFRTRTIAWAPDGQSVLLERHFGWPNDEVKILVVPLDGAEPFKAELATPFMQNLTIHPDGRTVFYQAGVADVRVFRTVNFLRAEASGE